jgi:hypothetical protein
VQLLRDCDGVKFARRPARAPKISPLAWRRRASSPRRSKGSCSRRPKRSRLPPPAERPRDADADAELRLALVADRPCRPAVARLVAPPAPAARRAPREPSAGRRRHGLASPSAVLSPVDRARPDGGGARPAAARLRLGREPARWAPRTSNRRTGWPSPSG